MYLFTVQPVERGDAPVILEPVLLRRQLDKATGHEASLQAGLRFQAFVKFHGVLADVENGL